MNKRLTIKSSNGTYQVSLIKQMENLIEILQSYISPVAIIDKNIAVFFPQLIDQLKKNIPLLLLDAKEELKTLEGVELILQFLQQQNATKSTTIIAIGGGITQDLASFAAHIYYRGLKFVYAPTTLLAMSDSCIGAKCGLNYYGFKNQIGAFHPPEKVLIWLGFLETLSEADILSGYGEIFKLFLIDKDKSYKELKKVLILHGFKNPYVSRHIFNALIIKKKFIEEDEFDMGIRRILNYGHTFGHALELASNYTIPHGVAVARGIDIANFIAVQLKILTWQTYSHIHQFIEDNFSCSLHPIVTATTLILNARKDKKVQGNKLKMVLLKEPGSLVIQTVVFDLKLQEILEDYLDNSPKLYYKEKVF